MSFHGQEILTRGTSDPTFLLKGKRTKRPKPFSPFALTMATASSSSSQDGGGEHDGGFCDLGLSCGGGGENFTASPCNSGELTQSTVEEEDMANCLILLAQGSNQSQRSSLPPLHNSKSITDVYECKTCNRRFPSFQALGGHRASHKKPKSTSDEQKPPVENSPFNKFDNTSLSLQITSSRNSSSPPINKPRVHECSICGAEFTSGQALGGHMRRHRPLPVATSKNGDSHEVKKRRLELLGLDLNLPAPEDETPESQYSFAAKDQVLVFATSPMVDCHF